MGISAKQENYYLGTHIWEIQPKRIFHIKPARFIIPRAYDIAFVFILGLGVCQQ